MHLRDAGHEARLIARDDLDHLFPASPIHRVQGRIEKIYGTWKRSYGLRRMRWRGLAKAACQVSFTAIAYNLKRALTIQAAA